MIREDVTDQQQVLDTYNITERSTGDGEETTRPPDQHPISENLARTLAKMRKRISADLIEDRIHAKKLAVLLDSTQCLESTGKLNSCRFNLAPHSNTTRLKSTTDVQQEELRDTPEDKPRERSTTVTPTSERRSTNTTSEETRSTQIAHRNSVQRSSLTRETRSNQIAHGNSVQRPKTPCEERRVGSQVDLPADVQYWAEERKEDPTPCLFPKSEKWHKLMFPGENETLMMPNPDSSRGEKAASQEVMPSLHYVSPGKLTIPNIDTPLTHKLSEFETTHGELSTPEPLPEVNNSKPDTPMLRLYSRPRLQHTHVPQVSTVHVPPVSPVSNCYSDMEASLRRRTNMLPGLTP